MYSTLYDGNVQIYVIFQKFHLSWSKSDSNVLDTAFSDLGMRLEHHTGMGVGTGICYIGVGIEKGSMHDSN